MKRLAIYTTACNLSVKVIDSEADRIVAAFREDRIFIVNPADDDDVCHWFNPAMVCAIQIEENIEGWHE